MALSTILREKGIMLARFALASLRTPSRTSLRRTADSSVKDDDGPVLRRRPRVIYPGDFSGTAKVHYRPVADGQPDPGEVIWTWVPFEEDHTQGKDRPVLVIGYDVKWLLGLMLSSQDRAPAGGVDQHQGREWLDVGPGAWDPRGRPSEVRLDRVLRIAPETVRREGAQMDPERFTQVAQALRERYGWS